MSGPVKSAWKQAAAPAYRAPLPERLAVALARAQRWEFWPAWAFYPPVVAYILWLGLRHRDPLLFTAANPGLEAGGFVGERKSDCLLPLMQRAPALVAPLRLLSATEPLAARVAAAQDFAAHNGGYPLVLKPDVGQRGRGVAIVRDQNALMDYLAHAPGDVIAQRYIGGSEFGLFIYREPGVGAARLYSITHKQFPEVVGDGRRRLRELIRSHPRARLISPLLWQRFAERMDWTPGDGERVPLVEIGAHCRGSLFVDGSALRTPALLDYVAQVFDALPGYHFGRLDVRCPSPEALMRGEDIRILEVNGVAAEAAHIYEPGTPLREAYASMMRQWTLAFEIGAENARAGATTPGAIAFARRVLEDAARGRGWF